ncbi:phage major capsid protein [Acholeplasma sp. OttesenSCG-928-E16]|nr:phage major capsid protein [Acholeplasma sp. OttesenSCG-928-E16]
MNLMKRKQEIDARLAEIRTSVDNETDVEKLTAMETECDTLNEERAMIEKKMNLASKTEVKPVHIEMNSESNEMLEKRGEDLKNKRTITVSSDEILLPNHVAANITPLPFREVSTIVDKVHLVNLNGGETYKKSYVKGHGEAGLTGEGESYTETEPTFDYVTITKVKVTAYTEITEELEKLPSLPYQAEVLKNINISLKKTIAKQILRGAGTSNTFTGIFSDKATAIEASSDISIGEINENTLDEIIFSFGGEEEVENGACIVLNKNDLRAFATLRTKEGRKVHTVDYQSQTIDGIPYIISSVCKSITDSNTAEGEYCIAYGSLSNYEVPIFSPVEIGKSTDYKFKDGIICYKASVFTGGNVTGFNGFLRVKKGASTPENEG